MSLTWKRSEIAEKVRAITGQLTTSDISDADLAARINDFYRNLFALDVYVAELEGWFTQVTAAGDGGEYDISLDYLKLDTPMTILDSDDVLTTVSFYQDKDKFFNLYPEEADPTEGKPVAVLLYSGTLYLRPEPDAIYTFKAASLKKPDELSTDDSVPLDVRWGPAIAYGTAGEMKLEDNDTETATSLIGIYQGLLNLINRKNIMQRATNQRATPRF